MAFLSFLLFVYKQKCHKVGESGWKCYFSIYVCLGETLIQEGPGLGERRDNHYRHDFLHQ